MSDDCCRPTITFPNGAYSTSQVRLYGISAVGGLVYPGKSQSSSSNNVSIATSITTGFPEKDKELNAEVNKNIEEQKKICNVEDDDIFRAFAQGNFPIKLPVGFSYQLAIDMRQFGKIALSTVVLIEEAAKKGRVLSSGIIFGYSFEGHCYDLPRPKIMLLPVFPVEIPHDDCGYDKKKNVNPNSPEKYMLWIVDKLDECVEFEMNQGFVEQLVLDANLPGKRSPSMYASRMMMGHRSGRLE